MIKNGTKMENVKKLSEKSKNIEVFSKSYFKRLTNIFDNLDYKQIRRFEEIFNEKRKKGNTIFVFGNGGSASTATTMSNDLGFDILKKTKAKKTFKFLCLNDNTSVLTAIANDVGYENVFLNQIKIHYKKGDIALILSASGNSENLVRKAIKEGIDPQEAYKKYSAF